MRWICWLGLLLSLTGPLAAEAPEQVALPPGFDPARHMRVSEVREGMTGYGVSVFKDSTLETPQGESSLGPAQFQSEI